MKQMEAIMSPNVRIPRRSCSFCSLMLQTTVEHVLVCASALDGSITWQVTPGSMWWQVNATGKHVTKTWHEVPCFVSPLWTQKTSDSAPTHQNRSKFQCIKVAENPSHNVQDSEDCDRDVHLSFKKLTDTVLMQTRDDYRWRAAMRMFSSGPMHEIIRTVQKNILKNQSNLGTRHCSLVTAGKPPQTQKPANEVLTCKPREPHLVFEGSWITPGEGPAWTNWCARVKRPNEVKSRETFSAQVPATANTLPFIVGFSDLRRTALPFQCKRVANAGATVGQSAINDVEADPGLLSVSSWSRATQKTKGSSKSNALEKPKVVRQFSKQAANTSPAEQERLGDFTSRRHRPRPTIHDAICDLILESISTTNKL